MQAENEIPLLEFEKLMEYVEEAPDEEATARQFIAALVASASLLMGLLGNVLFHSTPMGINVFLYVGPLSLAAFGLLIYVRRPVVSKHAVFAIPAAVFALLLGVRSAPPLAVFDAAAMFGSLLIVVLFTGTPRFMGGHWLVPIRRAFDIVTTGWLKSLREVVPDSLRWFGRAELATQHLATMRSVLRGVLITLPIAAVFTLLLSSADAIFGDFAERVLTFFVPQSAGSIVEQFFLIVIFTVISLVAFWTMVSDQVEIRSEPSPQAKTHRFRLNMIEASMVLGSVNFLFTTFVLIQARYFFGGQANITAQGYTYAEYARRGFYELLAVSCMTLLLLVTLENVTYRKREEEKTFRGLVVLMVVLTFVILIAAFRRLNLYENAYGYTRIRVMSGTFMIWLAVLLLVLLVAILRHRSDIVLIGCTATALGFILTLNLMNLDGFIASHNIARFEDAGKLDVPYLLSLSDDAIPTVATLIDNPELGAPEREQLLSGLAPRFYELDRDRATRGMFGYHIGKNRAWQALANHRDILQPYLYSRR